MELLRIKVSLSKNFPMAIEHFLQCYVQVAFLVVQVAFLVIKMSVAILNTFKAALPMVEPTYNCSLVYFTLATTLEARNKQLMSLIEV